MILIAQGGFIAPKETIDIIIAFGTLVAAGFAGISALIAAKATRETAIAIKLQRESIRAQTFVEILNYEREVDFSKGMDAIRELSDDECKDYKDFKEKNPDKAKHIRQVVDFLNHLAHLVRQGYVTPRHILGLYSASIEACQEKLLGEEKWLRGFRKEASSPLYYLNFECLCNNLENLWLGKKVNWPDPQFQASEEMRS